MVNQKAMKLYKVTLNGVGFPFLGSVKGDSYVVADGADEAHAKVKRYLEENNIGTDKDREMSYIGLLADSIPGAPCRTMLFL